MLVSQSNSDFFGLTPSATSQTPRIRIRTAHMCESSYPSRDVIRRQNYARRKAQEQQGWCCPRTIPYQGIDPVHLPPKSSKLTTTEQTANAISTKTDLRPATIGSASSRPKSGSIIHDEHTMKTQFDATIRRLHTAQEKHMKKSSDILKGVQLGHSVKDVVGKFSHGTIVRIDTAEIHGIPSVASDEKESEVLYDRLLDDFDEDDDTEGSSVSDIRDDIISPRTITTTNITSIDATEITDMSRKHPPEISFIPTKLCQSAPPLNRNNIRQATLRPFTPRYSGLSARLRLTRHMPFRDALYRQLCSILWLLRAMLKPDWTEMISGCWNIDQWLRSDNRLLPHFHQQGKKQHELTKGHARFMLPETKAGSATNTPKESALATLRTAVAHFDNSKKHNSNVELNFGRGTEVASDDQTGRRSILSEPSERLDLPLNSMNTESDLNESLSSKSNQGDTTDGTHLESASQTANLGSMPPTPAIIMTTTSRTSASTIMGQSSGRAGFQHLTSVVEQRRSPNTLRKKWLKDHELLVKKHDESMPLNDTQIRLLCVGDNEDLKRIFGLENATDANKEPVKERRTRELDAKLVANVRRRPVTSAGSTESKRHAQILHKIKRDFNDFTEEQSIILNNKLEQVDNNRLFYCQSKLRDLQKRMPPLTILERLLKQIRRDDDKKKVDSDYLKYQSWYVDLLQMIQPDYSDDHIIVLLLKEMEEYADPSEKPNIIRFKAVLSQLRSHEICHPDIMAGIEFVRIHIIKMGSEEFDKFFCKQFPAAAKYIIQANDTEENMDYNKLETKSTL